MKILPEDLMQVVIEADRRRHASQGREKFLYPRWKRVWVEPWFNFLGYLMGQALLTLPWPLRWRADEKIVRWMGARPHAEPARLKTARHEIGEMVKRLQKQTGVLPASFIFTSHPLTTGPLEWLRFEVMRQGLQLGNAVVEASGNYRGAPECFLAIDPFALDTVPTPVAGWYAGFMHRIYLTWDRQSGSQSFLQKHWLLRGTDYTSIVNEVMSRLRRSIPIVMMLPGGLPHNARLFYATREFVHRLPVRRWPLSKRWAQKRWMECIAKPVNGVLPTETGVLPLSVRAELKGLLNEWGFSESDQEHWLDLFVQEFRLDVPYRTRLFRALINRVVARGKPLIWIAITHRDTAPYTQISLPWAAYPTPEGDVRLLRGPSASPEPLADIEQVSMDFSREFVV
jgi:hypothetical protein